MKRKNKLVMPALAIILLLALLPKEVSAISVSASGAILMEQRSGRVLFAKEEHEVRRIASITKIMTAILAIESGKLEDTVSVSRNAVYTEGSSIYLRPGEKIKLKELVYGLMLRSGNDAAVAIAEHVGGSTEGFVFLMNQKAEQLGMSNTVFSNPHGLDDHNDHYSTPYDMALLTRYAMQDEQYRDISGTKKYRAEREDGPSFWTNKNRLLTEKYTYCTGGKTGFTKKAGRTLVTTASKNGIDLLAITIYGPDDWNDHIAMYEHGFQNYETVKLLGKGNLDIKGKGQRFFIKKSLYYPLAKGEYSDIQIEYRLPPKKELKERQKGKAGDAIVYFQGEEVYKIPIYMEPSTKDKQMGWLETFRQLFLSHTGIQGHD
ncbi:MAG TPA: D-alanyl-D-alanine carboxypeptidase family protein [Bacillaceae bacterium]